MGVIDGEKGAVAEQAVGDVNGGRLAGVPCVILEGKPEDGNLLSRHGVEHGGDHALQTGIEKKERVRERDRGGVVGVVCMCYIEKAERRSLKERGR